MSSNLKKSLIRLGYQQPHLRPHLKPILDSLHAPRQKAAVSWLDEARAKFEALGLRDRGMPRNTWTRQDPEAVSLLARDKSFSVHLRWAKSPQAQQRHLVEAVVLSPSGHKLFEGTPDEVLNYVKENLL